MMKNCQWILDAKQTGLLVVDVQEKLWTLVDRADLIIHNIEKVINGCQILDVPITVTEQYPQGLGGTIEVLKNSLHSSQKYLSKSSFSCVKDKEIKEHILNSNLNQWIIVGIEAHVCVLQTARDLVTLGKDVVVLNDAISSRSIFDFSTAIAEMRDIGVRISSIETVLFELVQDSSDPRFKKISELIK